MRMGRSSGSGLRAKQRLLPVLQSLVTLPYFHAAMKSGLAFQLASFASVAREKAVPAEGEQVWGRRMWTDGRDEEKGIVGAAPFLP